MRPSALVRSRTVSEERTLTTRDLNRAVLGRQLLLSRADISIPRALERIGGIQAQYAPSMYVGLWSRLADFDRARLTRALERRVVVQGTLLRSTIHLVSSGDYWPLAVAVRDGRRAWWVRAHAGEATADELADAAEQLRGRLDDGPVHRSDIERLIGKRLVAGVGLWLNLVRVPPSGTWERRRADLYHDAEAWIGPPQISRDEAIEHLVASYLRGFGPAPVSDIAAWAGISVSEIAPGLDRLQLRHFRTEDGADLVDLPRAPLPRPDTQAPPRFLPTWDSILLVHCRRAAILPEEYRPHIFNTKNPQSVPTFLVDGQVAGTWRYDGARVEIEPFEPLPQSARRELEREAERLAALHA
jgi:Winged helix DNA-binding domain